MIWEILKSIHGILCVLKNNVSVIQGISTLFTDVLTILRLFKSQADLSSYYFTLFFNMSQQRLHPFCIHKSFSLKVVFCIFFCSGDGQGYILFDDICYLFGGLPHPLLFEIFFQRFFHQIVIRDSSHISKLCQPSLAYEVLDIVLNINQFV